MKAIIKPSVLSGEIKAPPSKSMAHRLLISAGLANGESIIKNVDFSEDILATLDCLKVMGAEIESDENTVRIKGVTPFISSEKIFSARESGSTLRFFIPLLMLSDKPQMITAEGRLAERPLSVYKKIAEDKGLYFKREGRITEVCGKLRGGSFKVSGDISSQFISGLLFALPLCEEDSTVEITMPIESKSYIDMTIDALKCFGVSAEWQSENKIFIKGNQKYESRKIAVEGDFSNSAFLEAFNLFGSKVAVKNLDDDSLQGDKIYKKYFSELSSGASILDVSNCPDLAPVLMTIAAMKNGATLTGTKRLEIKESDRAEAMKDELSKFGADITVNEDSVIIRKTDLYTPTEKLVSHNDHRVVMALSVAASVFGGEIEGTEAVKKSYPDFFSDLKKLGAKIELNR